MRKLLTHSILLARALLLPAQVLTPVDNGSSVNFTIKNFGFNVTGSFKGLKGNIQLNPSNLSLANFKVSVDASTVNTGNGSRDSHLKKEEYFDVSKYPVLLFSSTKIAASSRAGEYLMDGALTIRGVTKNVSFPFVVKTINGGYLFTGEIKLNRRDFNVGGSSLVMSDNLIIKLSVVGKLN